MLSELRADWYELPAAGLSTMSLNRARRSQSSSSASYSSSASSSSWSCTIIAPSTTNERVERRERARQVLYDSVCRAASPQDESFSKAARAALGVSEQKPLPPQVCRPLSQCRGSKSVLILSCFLSRLLALGRTNVWYMWRIR